MEFRNKNHLSEEALRQLSQACDDEGSGRVAATADQHGGKVTVNGEVVYDSQSVSNESKR